MRLIAVVVALSVLCGCSPPPAVKPPPPKASSGVTTSQILPTDSSLKLVAFSVPDMECQHVCWPEVKKTLQGQEGIASVTLAEQPDEDKVVDKRVFLAVRDNFKADAAIEALNKVGFAESKVVEN